ncbi:MAG: mitochondrial processing peptidase [Rhodospirillaceae bacterium]|nr:MAG: mitochondrial processing peptidase [Rhodospirillaceae bacterium]
MTYMPRLPITALVLSVVIMMGTLISSPAASWIPNVKSFPLDNGLQVVVIENHRLPMVAQMVWYRVGSADEPPGKSGIAHMLEHMMFKGTREVSGDEFSRLVARYGGINNAATSYDWTIYYEIIAADQLELIMRLEADRMRNLTFDAEAFRTEHEVVREERRSRVDNVPGALLSEYMDAALWGEYPYRNPIIGWSHELKSLSAEGVTSFYNRWYAPNNAVLVVAGDVHVDQVRLLAEKYYGILPSREVPARIRPDGLSPWADMVVDARHPDVQSPWWSRAYVAPSYVQPMGRATHPYALQVLASLFGEGANGRLYRALVIEQKLAVEVEVVYSGGGLGFGTLQFLITPQEGVERSAMVAALEAEIKRLLEEGVTSEEVKRAKSHLQIEIVYTLDSLEAVAETVGSFISHGQTMADVMAWPERIAAVGPEDVMAVAQLVFGESPRVNGFLLPVSEPVPAAMGQ